MKNRLLMMLAFGLFSSSLSSIYAVPEPDPEYDFDFAELVIVGKILSVEILSEPQIIKNENSYSEISGIAIYDVQVEEYLKNPSNADVLTVTGYFLREPHPMAYETYPYDVDQRVLLYLSKNNESQTNTDFIIGAANSRVIEGSLCTLGTTFVKGVCVDDEIQCGLGTELIDGMCQVVKTEKTKTVGDDASFFGIFTYLDDLFSWIFGK